MNKLLWCVNVLLAVFALTATLAALHTEPGKTAPASPVGSRERPDAAPARTMLAAGRPRADLGQADILWQASLFRPDRAEESDPAGGAFGETVAGVSEMELIGVGMIGGEAAAIIAIGDKDAAPVRLTRPGRAPVAEPARKTPPHVFRRGQKVADSGFEVKSIELERVVLTRGDEERELKMDRRDAGSRRRTDLAAKEALTRTPPAVAPLLPPAPLQTTVVSGAPGAVPPPPPIPGTNVGAVRDSAGGVGGMSRDDRVKAALDARRKIIESRRLQER